MAVVTIHLTPKSLRTIREHGRLAGRAHEAIVRGIRAACALGADTITEALVKGELGITAQHPASGLAASIRGWMIDESAPLGAVGVPADSPAAAYAGILERGGTIYPKRARALAVPVSDEAKQYSSPRDMPDLTYIPGAKGRPPLLVRKMSKRGQAVGFEIMWVLLASVTIPAFHWLSKGAEIARGPMVDVMEDELNEYARKW